jgi:glycosyltransferase involved in cell wall biosynthesis
MDRILPLIRTELPTASFHVVGRNPPPSLLDRHGRNGMHVWGRVDDIRPWLKASDMALVPLDIGRGVQNKVLEAMSMALPVVLTTEAATGIAATDGVHFAVADSDLALGRAAVGLLKDPRQGRIMGLAARRFVTEEVSWRSALADLSDIIGWRNRPRSVRDAA